MAISQKQIADALSLSTITVSRALRNYPHLAEETRTRVLEKAQEMGYVKNRVAPTGSNKVKRAGIIFFESPDQGRVSFASRMRAMTFYSLQKECKRLSVETLIETVDLDESPHFIKNRTVDIAFIFGRYSPVSVDSLGDIPALAVSSFIEHPKLSRVVANNLHGMSEMTEYLIAQGHRKILFLGYRETHTQLFEERSHGYLIAMHRHALTPHMRFFPHVQKHYEIPEGFTAVACGSDSLAYTARSQLESAGKCIPEDISIVGFDNLADEYPIEIPKITSYAPDWECLGRTAAKLLIEQPEALHRKGLTVTVPGHISDYGSTAAIKA